MSVERFAFSAPRARVLVNGEEVGWATGITVQESFTNFGIRALGSVFVQSWATVAYGCSASIETIEIIGESLIQKKLFPEATTKAMVTFPEFTLECFDDISDVTQYIVRGCKWAGSAHALGNGGVLANGLRVDAKAYMANSRVAPVSGIDAG